MRMVRNIGFVFLMNHSEIHHLVKLFSKLPGLGPRSGRRAVLALLKEKEKLLYPLLETLRVTAEKIQVCTVCGNLDVSEVCSICTGSGRDSTLLCIVQDISDLWALERSGSYKGHYHVLGGVLSALEGKGPDDLNLKSLFHRLSQKRYQEVILALSPTMEGQTTSHYLVDCLAPLTIKTTIIAHGVPLGGELDYLDDGTLIAALSARRRIWP